MAAAPAPTVSATGAAVWQRFAEHYHVYAVDMIGFGCTDKPDPQDYSYTQQARNEHIIAVIETLGLPLQ